MTVIVSASDSVFANDWIHPFGDGTNQRADPWLQHAQNESRASQRTENSGVTPAQYLVEESAQGEAMACPPIELETCPLGECIDASCDACDSFVNAEPSQGLFATENDWQWTFLPKGVLYSTYWASAVEPRLSVATISESDHGALIDSSIGGRFPIVRFGSRSRLEGWQLDLIGGVRLRQDPNFELDMQANDFRYDLPLTYRKGQHAFKFGFYHVSSHTGDEFLVRNGSLTRKNFLRDTLTMGYSYFPIEELRLYSEAGWAFSSDVSEPWEFQFGFDYGPRTGTQIYGAPFIAANGHLREELDFGGNFNLQLGWAWRGEAVNAGTLRTGLHYYNGGSSQFSFFNIHEEQIGWGLWYDF